MVEFERAFAKRKEEVSSELLTFLRVWLTRHISFSDRKYKPYLIRKR
jgi:hemerythrin